MCRGFDSCILKAIDIARSAVIAPDATKSTTSLSPKRGGSCQFWAHADVNADSGIKNSLAKASASRSVSTGNSVALLSYSVGCSRMWPNSCAAVKIQRSTEIRSQVFTTTAGPPSSGPTLNPKSVLQRAVGVEPCNLCKNLLTRADELASSKPHAVQTPHRGDQFADWIKRFRKRLQRPRLRHDLPTLDLAYRDPRQPGRLCESLGTSDITPQC